MKTSHIVLIILSVCALAAILYLLTADNKATKSSITNDKDLLGSETTESYESYDTQDSIDLRKDKVTNSDAYQTMESDDFEINMPGYTKEQVLNAIKYYVMLSQAGESDIDDQIKSDYRSHLDNFANLIINPLFFILFQLVSEDVNTVFEVRNDDNTTTKYKFVEIDCGDEELCTEDNITNIKMIVFGNEIRLNKEENKYQYKITSNFEDFEDQTEMTFDTIPFIVCQSANDEYYARTTCDEGDETFTGPVYQQVTVSLAQYQEYVTSYSEYLISVLNTDET